MGIYLCQILVVHAFQHENLAVDASLDSISGHELWILTSFNEWTTQRWQLVNEKDKLRYVTYQEHRQSGPRQG